MTWTWTLDSNSPLVAGFWYKPNSSSRCEASFQVEAGTYVLFVQDGEERKGLLRELAVSDRLGDMPRRLEWLDGAMFETSSNEAIDALLKSTGHKASRVGILHKIESHWGWVATALVVTVLVSYLGVRYGLPAASQSIARNLPASFNQNVSEQSLKTLDRFVFEEAEVDAERQAEVQRQFDVLVAGLPESEVEYTLHFRSMSGIPNAMALPGGDVIVTDAFLDMIEHPQELDSVLLHEIGHVVERHGMTQVIQASALSVIVALAFGDLSALGELAVGVPVFMMQSSYSRSAETEADAFAFERMRELGKDPKHFASIILRLTGQRIGEQEDSSYFSSHPDSGERARKALEASRAL